MLYSLFIRQNPAGYLVIKAVLTNHKNHKNQVKKCLLFLAVDL